MDAVAEGTSRGRGWSLVPEQQQQDDDRKGNSDKPQQDALAHHFSPGELISPA
jgi:hypothetical protein